MVNQNSNFKLLFDNNFFVELPHDDGNYNNWLEGRRRKGKKGKSEEFLLLGVF